MSLSRKIVKVNNRHKALSVDLHCHIHTDAADGIAKQSQTNASPIARREPAIAATQPGWNQITGEVRRKPTAPKVQRLQTT